jgi:hypothetical protein
MGITTWRWKTITRSVSLPMPVSRSTAAMDKTTLLKGSWMFMVWRYSKSKPNQKPRDFIVLDNTARIRHHWS